MPDANTGADPGANAGANQNGGKGDDASTDQNKGGENELGKGGSDSGGTDEKSDAGKVVFDSQEAFEKVLSSRIKRAIKAETDKASLSETELLKKERDDAKKEVRERDLKDAFATTSGLPLGTAARLFKMYQDDIETDDAGKALNLAEVIKTAKAEFPTLFGKVQGGGDGGRGNGEGGGKPAGGDANAALRAMFK